MAITGVLGADVSHWQDHIDWKQVQTNFCFAKATQGTSFVDSEFEHNWKGMKANGIIRGSYHFMDNKSKNDGLGEAKNYLRVMDKVGGFKEGDLPPVLDWEAGATASEARVFVKALKDAGYIRIILYCSASVIPDDLFGATHLWVARYGPQHDPDIDHRWRFWQFTDGYIGAEPHSVPGIGRCDNNVFYSDLEKLKSFAAKPVKKEN